MDFLINLFVAGMALLVLFAFGFLVLAQVTAHALTDPRAAADLGARVAAKRARRAAARAAAGDAHTAPAQGEFAPARPGWSSVPPPSGTDTATG